MAYADKASDEFAAFSEYFTAQQAARKAERLGRTDLAQRLQLRADWLMRDYPDFKAKYDAWEKHTNGIR